MIAVLGPKGTFCDKSYEEYNKKYQEAEQDKKELDNLIKSLKMATSKRADDLEKAIKDLAK